jgi:hypothetical protein
MNIELDKAIAKFQKECKAFAKSYMQENEELPMVVIFLAQNDKHEFIHVVAPDIGPMHAQDKPRFIAAIKSAIATIKPVAVALLTEAWIVKRPIGSDIDINIRASQQPDREEVVMVQIETYKNAGMHLYDIIRHTTGNISLEYDEETSSDFIDKSNTQGTFSNLLKENYDKFYRDIVESINKNQN